MVVPRVSKYDVEPRLVDDNTSHALLVELVGFNKLVLDVGCSTGYLARIMAGQGNRVSGVEFDAGSAEQARPHLEQLVVGDLDRLDLTREFGESAFDVVVFGDVLEHLRDPLRVLRGARPLLKPGGSVVVSVPNIAHGDVRLALLYGRFRYRELGLLDETHLRFFTRESLGEFIRSAGFVLADVRRTTAELFSTEIGVRAEDYDPPLLEVVRADPESTTYQFVVRAVRDDTASLDTELTHRLEQQTLRVAESERLRAEAQRQRAEAVDALAALRERERSWLDRVGRLEEDIARHRAELNALRATRLMRAARLPRAVYSRLRRGARR